MAHFQNFLTLSLTQDGRKVKTIELYERNVKLRFPTSVTRFGDL